MIRNIRYLQGPCCSNPLFNFLFNFFEPFEKRDNCILISPDFFKTWTVWPVAASVLTYSLIFLVTLSTASRRRSVNQGFQSVVCSLRQGASLSSCQVILIQALKLYHDDFDVAMAMSPGTNLTVVSSIICRNSSVITESVTSSVTLQKDFTAAFPPWNLWCETLK